MAFPKLRVPLKGVIGNIPPPFWEIAVYAPGSETTSYCSSLRPIHTLDLLVVGRE